jgi:hypothetical protein
MVKRFALMESLSANLHDFLKKVSGNLLLPDRKFLRDAIIGLLRCGQPIICKMARVLPNQRTKITSRIDRLDEQLLSNGDFDKQVQEAAAQTCLPLITDDTPIILDLSDLAKPFSRKMDYLATVRDGSTGRLVSGYWLVEMYASVNHSNPVPVLLEPFSHNEPESAGQNPVVCEAIRRVFKLTNNRGVLVADRGFDARRLLDDWLDNEYRFVVRLVGKRHLLCFTGANQWVAVQSRLLAEQIPTPYHWHKVVKRHGKPNIVFGQLGWAKVRLPGRDENLTMVVSRLAGLDRPMMLLTNVPVENLKDAIRVLRYYIRRWECEQAIKFLKGQVNLEKLRTFRWNAIRRLVLLAVLVMLYLTLLVETSPALAERLIRFGQPLPNSPRFVLYRLLTGVTEAITGCFWLRRSLLEAPL